MTLEDLTHIFQKQIDEGTTRLYFMLIDGEYKIIERHSADDIASLLPMLSDFTYDGSEEKMPRFIK